MRIFCDGGKLIDSGRLVALDELRGLVCWRRASGGSQSDRGNQFAANLKSVIR